MEDRLKQIQEELEQKKLEIQKLNQTYSQQLNELQTQAVQLQGQEILLKDMIAQLPVSE